MRNTTTTSEGRIVRPLDAEAPVIDLQALADRVEIEALRAEMTDSVMIHDYDRFASLFAEDGAWRIPYVGLEFIGRAQIRAAVERAQDMVWNYFIQTTHPGVIKLDGDRAFGRAYVHEFGLLRSGRSQLHFALYHDRYLRTLEGWKFAERTYEIRYVDNSALAGAPPGTTHVRHAEAALL